MIGKTPNTTPAGMDAQKEKKASAKMLPSFAKRIIATALGELLFFDHLRMEHKSLECFGCPGQGRFEEMRAQQHIVDRAQLLGNFALASADAHDWPQAVAQLKEAIETCGKCSALPQLHKDLGLIYCHSGDLKNGRVELLEAQKLSPGDEDVAKALQLLEPTSKTE